MSFVDKIEYAVSTKNPTLIGARIYNLIARSMFINTVLAGFFSWIAFKSDISWGGLIVDFVITNMFLTYFLVVGSRSDLRGWTEKMGIAKATFDPVTHKKYKSYIKKNNWALFGWSFVVYGVKYAIPYFGIIYLSFSVVQGVADPNDVSLVLFLKLVWLIFFTDEATRKAGMAGTIDPQTVK